MSAKNQHNPTWTIDQLNAAIEEVKNGAPKRKTAEKYGIPWGTFSDKLSGRRKMGEQSKTVLTKEEEGKILDFLKMSSARGFGKTKDELLVVVKNYLDQKGRVTQWENNKPSTKWFRLFRKRHPEIVFRKPQLLGKQRALVTKRDILDWFGQMTKVLKQIDPTIFLEPERIYNCDESGFSLNALSGRILSYLDNNFVYQVGSEAKTLITALVCCSAKGHYTWPMLIYPGTQFRGFKPQEVFEESFIGRSENGWITQNLFYEWLKQVFVPQTAHVKKPLLLLVDGHISHQSVQASKLCCDNNIVLYCLPPHSSHILQPLDVGVFKTMKSEWKKAVKRQNETEIVTKRTFAKTFKDAYETTIARPLADKAFRACGLYPLDPTNVDWSKVVSGVNEGNPDAQSTPQSSLANGHGLDTPLPAPIAHSAHSTPPPLLSRPPIAHSTPQSPQPSGPLIAHSTPQSPQPSGPLIAQYTPQSPQPSGPPIAHSTPQSPQPSGPLIAHSTPQSPQPSGPLIAHSTPPPLLNRSPIAHSTPQSPQPSGPLIAHSTPQSPQPSGPSMVHSTPQPSLPNRSGPATISAGPSGSGVSKQGPYDRPQTSKNTDASTQATNTLRKFAMICAQIGDATLNLYYTRLEEGYDCNDPLFTLWRTYNNELVSLMAPKVPFADKEGQNQTNTNSQVREKNALAIPSLTKGARRTKTLKLPALISSPDFRRMLMEKEADDKAEEARKKQRKLDLEEREKAKAIEEEQKKAKREEKKKEGEEKKRQKEVQTQLRKEERKRKLEENRKAKEEAQRQKKSKTRKTCKKLYKSGSDSDTPVDDSTMVLDDNSSDDFAIDCGSDDSTVDKIEEYNDGVDRSVAVCELPNDSSLSQYLEVSQKPTEQREPDNGDNVCEQPTKERNLWLDLAAESIASITPTLPRVEDE